MDEVAAVDPRAGDRIVLHLADVTALDSVGVGALFYLEAFVRVRRGRLVIAMPAGRAAGTITGSTLERHFSFVESPDEPGLGALASGVCSVTWSGKGPPVTRCRFHTAGGRSETRRA